ncbi:MAG: Ig-like domain repeat protein, partial [Tepidisphaeraceae bacterium]
MGLRDVYQRMGFGAKRSSTHGRFLMDQLESRSLLSASPASLGTVVSSDPVISPIQTLAATKPTATLIKVYGKTSAAGAEVSIAAAVVSRSSGVPTGTITFMAGDTVLGTKTLGADGSVKISTTAIPSGTSVITAVYSGSSKFGASTSVGVSHVVTLAASTTKLSVTSDAGTTFGIPTTLLARVGSAANGDVPTGRVAFYDGGTLLGSKVVNSQGAARFTANFLYVGSHDLKAIYLGSGSYLGHRSTVKTVTVNAPTLSTASNGLQVASILPGSGASVSATDYVTVDYTLYVNGTELQSSIG